MSGIKRIVAALSRLAAWAATIALIASVLLNFVNVIGRYAFNAPISWAEETMLFLMIGGVFLAAGVVAFESSHIRVEILVDLLPKRPRKGARALAHLAEAATALLLVVITVPVVHKLFLFNQKAEAAEIPVWIPQATIPLGFLLLGLVAAFRVIAVYRKPEDSEPGGGAR
ncbi:MAG: TRAP transporter small permease subunit [Rhodospirillales bacterium]|nr:TRAP transporter small permease subunit [Rhodospirillales bacterium]